MTSKLVGTSSSTRTLDQRDLAALRPMPAPRPRAPRKATEKRVVSSGIVCFCGERFAESQALEFMLHLRAEVGSDLKVAESLRRRHREERRRISADPERAARRRERDRKRQARLMEDPEYRARQRAIQNAARADPEIRKRRAEAERDRKRRKKAEREGAGSSRSTRPLIATRPPQATEAWPS